MGGEKRQRGRSTVEMELERRWRVELGHKELQEKRRCKKKEDREVRMKRRRG